MHRRKPPINGGFFTPPCSPRWHLDMVRVVGLEPTRLTAQEPKSCVSTNSTIPAYSICPLFLLGEGLPGAERYTWSASIKTGHACFYLVDGNFFTEVTAPKSRMSTNSITGAYSIFLDFSSQMAPEAGTLSYHLYKQKITLFAIEQNQSSSHQ